MEEKEKNKQINDENNLYNINIMSENSLSPRHFNYTKSYKDNESNSKIKENLNNISKLLSEKLKKKFIEYSEKSSVRNINKNLENNKKEVFDYARTLLNKK